MNNNPTAFPYMEISEDGVTLKNHSGMTLRDHFAGCAVGSSFEAVNRNPRLSGNSQKELAEEVANLAYLVADAMLAARKDA